MRAPFPPTIEEVVRNIKLEHRKLRDEIAMKAMQSFLEIHSGDLEFVAKRSYEMADIMMKTR